MFLKKVQYSLNAWMSDGAWDYVVRHGGKQMIVKSGHIEMATAMPTGLISDSSHQSSSKAKTSRSGKWKRPLEPIVMLWVQ